MFNKLYTRWKCVQAQSCWWSYGESIWVESFFFLRFLPNQRQNKPNTLFDSFQALESVLEKNHLMKFDIFFSPSFVFFGRREPELHHASQHAWASQHGWGQKLRLWVVCFFFLCRSHRSFSQTQLYCCLQRKSNNSKCCRQYNTLNHLMTMSIDSIKVSPFTWNSPRLMDRIETSEYWATKMVFDSNCISLNEYNRIFS